MSTIPTGTDRVTYRITGTVNGKRRFVILEGPRGLDADTVYDELLINHEGNYKRFYRGATDKDFDAEIEDLLIEVHDWSELE